MKDPSDNVNNDKWDVKSKITYVDREGTVTNGEIPSLHQSKYEYRGCRG